MERKERERLIALYRDGYRAVVEAMGHATAEEMGQKPAPNKWSPREIIHHLADSEMTSAIRLRMLLAADRPTIYAYDQDQFARVLYYDRPHEASLEAFRYARECTAQILDRLTEDQWLREGTHSEAGAFGVERWLQIYAEHAHKHAQQILTALDGIRKNQG